jgi:hypothetical protein
VITPGSGLPAGTADDTPLDPAWLDRWWNFDRPAESEARFRAEVAKLPDSSAARLELLTQLARAQGLQRRFDDAHATLDQVETALPGRPSRVAVRYLLERGRVFNSSQQPERAVPLFPRCARTSARRQRGFPGHRRGAHAGHCGRAARPAGVEPEPSP